MAFPAERPRRLRAHPSLRRMARETRLCPDHLMLPLFVTDAETGTSPVESMPGVERMGRGPLLERCREAVDLGIPAVLLFGIVDAKAKDEAGSAAWDEAGPVPAAIRDLKKALPDLLVVTDVCLCGYTSHGHCGLVRDGVILNDATLPNLARMALCHARAGADMVAPSDMMDGRIGHLRAALDAEGFKKTGILSYAVKYASAYYGPFRDAAGSAPAFGDRRTHQMDPANVREALREARLDAEEGADMLMVKPALAYLDVIRAVRNNVDRPVAAYNVSGEYSMIKAAAERGWIDEQAVVTETLTAMRRAGADVIVTYHALDAARWMNNAG